MVESIDPVTGGILIGLAWVLLIWMNRKRLQRFLGFKRDEDE